MCIRDSYTRDAIVEALQEELPEVIGACINAYHLLHGESVEDVKVDIPFGEYANPSFESQVETLTKARPGAPVMSVEAQVEELYGDSKDEAWKKEEIARLKAEQGIAEVEEPGVNLAAGGFQVNMEGVKADGGNDRRESLENGPRTVQEPSGVGK